MAKRKQPTKPQTPRSDAEVESGGRESRFANRIVELKQIPRGDIADHPGQIKTHGEAQRRVMTHIQSEYGVWGAIIVYHSEKLGGWVAIDGHMRKELDEADTNVPCLVTDLTDDEAAIAVQSHDAIALMAGMTDTADDLLRQLAKQDEALQDMVSTIVKPATKMPSDTEIDSVQLDRVDLKGHKKQAWVLIGIPTSRFGEISELVEQIGDVSGVYVDTCMNDKEPPKPAEVETTEVAQ